jgi:hypothetical protein
MSVEPYADALFGAHCSVWLNRACMLALRRCLGGNDPAIRAMLDGLMWRKVDTWNQFSSMRVMFDPLSMTEPVNFSQLGRIRFIY